MTCPKSTRSAQMENSETPQHRISQSAKKFSLKIAKGALIWIKSKMSVFSINIAPFACATPTKILIDVGSRWLA
jgi:hypothetical protein